jgi:probable F420-dependent oxidoreductase
VPGPAATVDGDRLSVGLVVGDDLERAPALEALPVDSLWVGGHVASRNPSPEAMVALARLSAVTERVRIGTSALVLPLYPPAVVAKQVADLDRATGGRVILGVGVGGEYPQEFRACRVPLGERGPRCDEAIGLLRRLWTGDEVTHGGPRYAMADVRVHPPPAQPGGPPVVVAGRKAPAMRRAATLGDGWMPYLFSPRRYAESVATIRAAAARAGRDLAGFGWYVFVFVHVDRDGDRARAAVARSLGRTQGRDAADVRPLVDRVAAAGTAGEVAATLAAFVDAGARHLVLAPAPGVGDRDRVVRCLFDEVMPTVRDRSARPRRD